MLQIITLTFLASKIAKSFAKLRKALQRFPKWLLSLQSPANQSKFKQTAASFPKGLQSGEPPFFPAAYLHFTLRKPMENIYDAMLYRQLKDGKEYDSLIPKVLCERIPSGDGSTDLSMRLIKEVSNEYSWQMGEVAKVLQKKSLEATCIAIHDFAYSHHQYKADEDDQLLRSPACSWHQRRTGIDCKSYSIIASALLAEMELIHYIRKIKQPGLAPDEYTHVYVVVPKDQQTGSLAKGHYTIDGTLPTVQEPSYLVKTDLKMMHHKLNAPHVQGLNGGVSLSQITGLFKSFNCIGGSGFTEGAYGTSQGKMNAYFDQLAKDINDSIVAKDFAGLALNVNEFFVVPKVSYLGYEKKLSEKNWNDCTKARLRGMIAMSKFYRDTAGAALTAYLSKYFTKTAGGGNGPVYNNQAMEGDPYGFYYVYTGGAVTMSEPLSNYAVLSGVPSIPRFEITQPVVDANGSSLNILDYIKSLTTTLVTFLPTTPSPGTGSGTGSGSGTGYYNQPVVPAETQKAGFGTVAMVGVAALACAALFVKTPSKPIASPRNAPSGKTAAKRKSTAKKR